LLHGEPEAPMRRATPRRLSNNQDWQHHRDCVVSDFMSS
jgi:hypothetical protein